MAFSFQKSAMKYLVSDFVIAGPFTMTFKMALSATASSQGFPAAAANAVVIDQARYFQTYGVDLGISAVSIVGGTPAIASVVKTLTKATTYTITGIFNESSRSCYVDTQKTTDTATSSVQNSAYLFIGAISNSLGFDGQISDFGVWSAALTDAEVNSLAKGFKPSRIRPQSLVFYAPLVRAAVDLARGITLTPVNGPTVAPHPRVY